MKYAYYIFVLFTVILRRLIFPLIYLAIPVRGFLRNSVYNYHLKNNKILKRLSERNPVKVENGWQLNNIHGTTKGFVKENRFTLLKYIVSLPLWLLLDDDSMADTYDAGFNKTIIDKERKTWMPKFIVKRLSNAKKSADVSVQGNSFDLGDKRAENGLFSFWSNFWWTLRNPSYNFNYKFNEIVNEDLVFKIVIANRIIGWLAQPNYSDLVDNDGKRYTTYTWELGRKI